LNDNGTVMTKETAISEVTMNAVALPEFRSAPAADEAPLKTTTIECTAVNRSPVQTSSSKPGMKTATIESAARRTRPERLRITLKRVPETTMGFSHNQTRLSSYSEKTPAPNIAPPQTSSRVTACQ